MKGPSDKVKKIVGSWKSKQCNKEYVRKVTHNVEKGGESMN